MKNGLLILSRFNTAIETLVTHLKVYNLVITCIVDPNRSTSRWYKYNFGIAWAPQQYTCTYVALNIYVQTVFAIRNRF